MKKTVVITALITTGLIVISLANFTVLFNQFENNSLEKKNNNICQDLNRTVCIKKEVCKPVYGPSACSDNICTTDYVFQGCREK